MTIQTRQLLVRLMGAALGVVFIIKAFNDLRSGQLNWHGNEIRRATEPFTFWIGTGFDAFAALVGLMILLFGTRSK